MSHNHAGAMKHNSGMMGVVLLAAVAGAVAGMLFAPKKGQETREDLKQKYNEMKNKTQDKAMDMREKAEQGIESARSKVSGLADKTKDVADKVASKADQAAADMQIQETTLADEIAKEHSKRNRPAM